jgi:hypothetical protein
MLKIINIICLLYLYKKDINEGTTDEDNVLIDYNGTMINNLIGDVLLEAVVCNNYKVVNYILNIGCKYDLIIIFSILGAYYNVFNDVFYLHDYL